MTSDEIKRAREIIEAATEGLWETGDAYGCFCVFASDAEPLCIDIRYEPNAQFIAAARTGWPAALDALETACGDVDIARYERDCAEAKIGLLHLGLSAMEHEREQLRAEVERLRERIKLCSGPCTTATLDDILRGTDQ